MLNERAGFCLVGLHFKQLFRAIAYRNILSSSTNPDIHNEADSGIFGGHALNLQRYFKPPSWRNDDGFKLNGRLHSRVESFDVAAVPVM